MGRKGGALLRPPRWLPCTHQPFCPTRALSETPLPGTPLFPASPLLPPRWPSAPARMTAWPRLSSLAQAGLPAWGVLSGSLALSPSRLLCTFPVPYFCPQGPLLAVPASSVTNCFCHQAPFPALGKRQSHFPSATRGPSPQFGDPALPLLQQASNRPVPGASVTMANCL